MTKSKGISGIHIQWPWSELIISGEKTIETRHYPLPKKHLGNELAIIETPGPNGKKGKGIQKSHIIGTVIFSECFAYTSEQQWRRDIGKHLVRPDDQSFGYDSNRVKWAWVISEVKKLPKPKPPPKKRGIVFANECHV